MIINNLEWKKFKIKEIVDEKNIYKSYSYAKSDMQIVNFYDERAIPFVSRTDINNSVDCYVDSMDVEKFEKGNAIIVGDTTATVSYQKEDFITGDHIVVIRADWLNEYTGLFICTLLKKENYRYSYGRAFLKDSIKETEIYLPIDKKENPNWKFIEEYIKKFFNSLSRTKIKANYNQVLLTQNWQEFKIGKLFPKIKIEKYSSIPENSGASRFISSSSLNNGVSAFVVENTIPGNCITVSTNGDCFDAFYQGNPIVVSSDVEVLYSDFLNEKIALFICTILKQEKYKWSYGRKPKNNKVFNTIIKLPVECDKLGNIVIDKNKKYSKEGYIPDFAYMERYIKNLSYGDLF